ncbi:MAG: GNAT family N-acetyltransferase [Bdellovibrionia bacterium]
MTHKEWRSDKHVISTDPELLDLLRVHGVLSKLYWCEGIPFETVKKACEGSLCFGVYEVDSQGPKGLKQVGLARVITDSATFAYLCDVYIEESSRGQGLSKWLMTCIQSHPQLQGLRRFSLATRDAHGLYRQFGFEVTKAPERWMEIVDSDVYKRTNKS